MIASEIHDACQEFGRGSLHWCTDLAHRLDDQKIGLAYQWMKRCVRRLLPMQCSENELELTADLESLDDFERSCPTFAAITARAREIWHRPNRDAAQVAVSKLYASVPSADGMVRVRRPTSVYLLVESATDKPAAFKVVAMEYQWMMMGAGTHETT
jgi:hypothetical protein